MRSRLRWIATGAAVAGIVGAIIAGIQLFLDLSESTPHDMRPAVQGASEVSSPARDHDQEGVRSARVGHRELSPANGGEVVGDRAPMIDVKMPSSGVVEPKNSIGDITNNQGVVSQGQTGDIVIGR